jgi:hypothetical protein
MRFDPDGAQLFPAAVCDDDLAALAALLTGLGGRRPGLRDLPGRQLEPLIPGADRVARVLLGHTARAVGAKFFDKSAARNWALGWHQDRTVPVRERREVAGFTGWTVKDGIPHCVPPFEILARTLTLRLHIDAAAADNAPLLVAPGSHRLGLVQEQGLAAAVERCGTRACLAEAGDIWAYETAILHRSDRSASPRRRRVLQLLYSADDLPGGLEWRGI